MFTVLFTNRDGRTIIKAIARVWIKQDVRSIYVRVDWSIILFCSGVLKTDYFAYDSQNGQGDKWSVLQMQGFNGVLSGPSDEVTGHGLFCIVLTHTQSSQNSWGLVAPTTLKGSKFFSLFTPSYFAKLNWPNRKIVWSNISYIKKLYPIAVKNFR